MSQICKSLSQACEREFLKLITVHTSEWSEQVKEIVNKTTLQVTLQGNELTVKKEKI